MVITRTPYRLSFFGGGTDYPAWYRLNGGAVLATTIDKYCYISCRLLPPFFDHRFRVVYSRVENCKTVDEIQHPAVRETLKLLNVSQGVEIHHDGDLPARSGMGSSSAFTVGLLNAIHALNGRMSSKYDLSREGIALEQEILREIVGSQDQVCAAYGGLNHIRFLSTGEILVRPVTLSVQRQNDFCSHLMLFYTGIQRTAAQIAESYVSSLEHRSKQLDRIRTLVDESLAILCGNTDLSEFGRLLHESWCIKRSLSSKVSCREIDDTYDAARNAGAIGGKITGAGGGGFLLLFVPPANQKTVRDRLSHLIHVPFTFEDDGSQVIFFSRDKDYTTVENDQKSRHLAVFREIA